MAHYVVHEHHSKQLHFDLRLEFNGVLKSFAIPKGPSMNPKEKRLAIRVEDHPLDYKDFEGIIPEGSYGAGYVVIWDRGTYKILKGSLDEGLLELMFNGKELKGIFILKRLKSDKDWLLFKKKDGLEDHAFKISLKLTEDKKKQLKEREVICQTS